MRFEAAVVGLGNPGAKYDGTRHNIGFETVDALSRRYACGSAYLKFNAALQPAELEGVRVLLAKPLTYMNRSGHAVRALSETYGIPPENIWIVLDDFHLTLGSLRLRLRGSAGSHNGLRSVLQELGTEEAPRARLGIGPAPHPSMASNFALSPFRRSEKPVAAELIEYTADALIYAAANGFEAAMNRFNRTIRPDSQADG